MSAVVASGLVPMMQSRSSKSNNNKTHAIYRPMAPGEEVILHCGPLHDVTTLIVEILYPLSVSGTIVIPPCDTLYNYAKTFKIMKEIQPTLIWGSSKFYEKMYHKLWNMHYSMSKIKKLILGKKGIFSLQYNINPIF